jgi:hypothetical protein
LLENTGTLTNIDAESLATLQDMAASFHKP